ncbi:ribonuclease inhibitor [Kaistella sp. G5-32]|uniref:Ribonuclease inhibitor n=1 Tax=Kaistella gelatinilytica TaxID=2787636 RepID=A0ABS0FEV9_9FLAO|nr:ribonuclease inhibitor [Kaistella gelatinilytica]MBF8458221.1 ribonuclease inhibitor [Kaistella gelatinilytica]
MKQFFIKGENIKDISAFYEEMNRLFMRNEDWKIGASLDALDDLFYGGFGEIKGNEDVELIWQHFQENRKVLGLETTLEFYEKKLRSPEIFNSKLIQEKIKELNEGTGQTYFEIILKIISDHPNIHLIEK